MLAITRVTAKLHDAPGFGGGRLSKAEARYGELGRSWASRHLLKRTAIGEKKNIGFLILRFNF